MKFPFGLPSPLRALSLLLLGGRLAQGIQLDLSSTGMPYPIPNSECAVQVPISSLLPLDKLTIPPYLNRFHHVRLTDTRLRHHEILSG